MELEIIVKVDGEEIMSTKKTVTEFDTENKDVEYHSQYARIFDETCAGWEKNVDLNLIYLRMQQRHANDLLKKRGHLFLNDLHDLLGMSRTKDGAVVGWVYDPERNTMGDNYVDFGISVRGDHIVIDPNVDGNILEWLDKN